MGSGWCVYLDVLLELANILEVLDIEKDLDARQERLQTALNHRDLVLAGAPHVREEDVVTKARRKLQVWRTIGRGNFEHELAAPLCQLPFAEETSHNDDGSDARNSPEHCRPILWKRRWTCPASREEHATLRKATTDPLPLCAIVTKRS